jgi:hypothetical protein
MTLGPSSGPTAYPADHRPGRALVLRDVWPPEAPKPRLLDRVREALCTGTTAAAPERLCRLDPPLYRFHGKRHPDELDGPRSHGS